MHMMWRDCGFRFPVTIAYFLLCPKLLTIGFEELLGMQVALQHALIEQHVAHGLRDDDVNLLRQRHLLHLPRDDDHALP